jgi:hypothetical protein
MQWCPSSLLERKGGRYGLLFPYRSTDAPCLKPVDCVVMRAKPAEILSQRERTRRVTRLMRRLDWDWGVQQNAEHDIEEDDG